MGFKKTARNVGKTYGMGEDNSVVTLTILHELIEELIAARIGIDVEDFFHIRYTSTKFQDNITVGENKKVVQRALTSGKNFYVRGVKKFD